MPRKPRGILSRLVSGLKRLTSFFPGDEPGPVPQPEPIPEPTPPPKPPPIIGDSFPVVSHEARMLGIYERITGRMTEYLDWRELYDPLTVVFDSDAQIERYWDMFLRSFYLTTSEPGHIVRGSSKKPGRFYRDTGIPPSEVDWELWRDMRRGTT